MTPHISLLISLSGVIGALIGVTMNNVVNVRLQNRKQLIDEKAKAREVLCAKGEALVVALENFATYFRETTSEISMALYDPSRKHPVEYADFLKANEQLALVNMLTRIYFETSIPALEMIESHRLSLSKIAVRLVQSRRSTSDDEKTGREILLLAGEVATCVGSFQRQIIDRVHGVQSRPLVK